MVSINSTSREKFYLEGKTHKSVLLEDLLAPGRELDRQHRDLPAVIAAADLDAQCAAEDLVPETHADDADAVLLQQFLSEGDEL